MENKSVGNYLKTIRIQKGYSEEYMSFKLNVSQSTISNVENGKIKIDIDRINEFCSVLEIDILQLMHQLADIPPENNHVVNKSGYKPNYYSIIEKLDLIAGHFQIQNQLLEELLDNYKQTKK